MLPYVVALLALAVGVAIGLSLAASRRRSEHSGVVQAAPAVAPVGPAVHPKVGEVLDVLRSASLVVDPSDRVIRASASATQLGLVRGSEVAHEQVRTLVRSARRDHDLHEVELDVARGFNAGGRLVLGVRVAALGDNVLVLADDRTHSRRVEETRRDFVVNVSHELKTPVAGLSLLAEAVLDAADDPEAVRRFSGRMRGETDRLTRLVQEIVQLSRLQVADTLDDPKRIDVRACARDAVDHLRLLAEDRNISLVTDLGSAPAEVFGDPNLITTAIRNLVENAVNYSGPNTKVALTVVGTTDLITISVKDQGSGIPAIDLERIFERFYRVDAARSRRTGGTGLGLAIVKHVSANHGGEVTVWSEEGHGSTFTIRLPAAAPLPAAEPDADRKAPE
ncbi:sensor histidine kinase [Calidifontibacter terrae]